MQVIDMCSYIVPVIVYETSDSFAKKAKNSGNFYIFERKKLHILNLNFRQGKFFLFSYHSFHKINTLYLSYCISEIK